MMDLSLLQKLTGWNTNSSISGLSMAWTAWKAVQNYSNLVNFSDGRVQIESVHDIRAAWC